MRRMTSNDDTTPSLADALQPLPANLGQHATKLRRSLHSGRLATALRDAIVDGTLPTGTPLVEARLADELQVSRGPVRSALHVLEGEGLARTQPNGRMVVAGLTREDVRDLLDVRYEIETLAIRWGLERGADTAPIEQAFRDLADEPATTERLVELDITFHRALVELSGSRFLLRSWLAIAPVLQSVITIGNRRLGVHDPETHLARIVDAHTALMEALRVGDVDAAAQRLADQFALTQSMFTDGREAAQEET